MILKEKKFGYLDMITMAYKTSPFFTLIGTFVNLLDALLPIAQIFIIANFIDTAILIFNGYADFSAAYIPVLLLCALRLYPVLMETVMGLINTRRHNYFYIKIMPMMLERLANLHYRYIESSKSQDLINRLVKNLHIKIWDMYKSFLEAKNLIIYVSGIMITLAAQVWWVTVVTATISILLIFIARTAGKRRYQADREMTKMDRYAAYLSNVMLNREAADERNVFDSTEGLNRQYEEKYEFARKHRLNVEAKNLIRQKLGEIITSLFPALVMLVLIPAVANGRMEIGMFIALVTALFGYVGRLLSGINNIVVNTARNREFLNDLTEFMALEIFEDATAKPANSIDFSTIEFKNVSFSYPHDDETLPNVILNDVSFTIERGKHYAFVGVNGAGKTTIIKLLTGLYDNYAGEILVDERELRTFSQAQIKGLTSVVYQDFARYYIPMIENITLSDADELDLRKNVENALAQVGLSEVVDKLKDGMDTPLGKIYEGGVDVSGGEWQKIALARSLLNPAPLRILDEPTAALDPVAESIVYRNFENMSKGRTTIFISHRLGSTKLADTIFVLSEGKLAESGSHVELMALGGIYSEMHTAQAEWYENSEVNANV